MVNSKHSKEKPNCGDIDHERRSTKVVKCKKLYITYGHQPNFKAINFTTRPKFNNIGPSTAKSLLSKEKRNKLPHVIAFKNQHFISHGLSLSRMVKCLMNSFRNDGDIQRRNKRIRWTQTMITQKIINSYALWVDKILFLRVIGHFEVVLYERVDEEGSMTWETIRGRFESWETSGRMGGAFCALCWYVRSFSSHCGNRSSKKGRSRNSGSHSRDKKPQTNLREGKNPMLWGKSIDQLEVVQLGRQGQNHA